jgi:hypothetical protein
MRLYKRFLSNKEMQELLSVKNTSPKTVHFMARLYLASPPDVDLGIIPGQYRHLGRFRKITCGGDINPTSTNSGW